VESLADPSRFSLAEALEIARETPGIDVRLAERLGLEIRKPGARPLFLFRLIELLAALDCGQHVVPFQSILLAHADARIRSKTALIVGRILANAGAIEKLLRDPDRRVQANAIRSIWGMPGSDFHRLLNKASQSSSNRLAANALVGLYRLGDHTSISRLYAMARRPSQIFRASARWAMGETGDPRFLPWLTAAFKRDPGHSGGVVLRSLSRIRQNVSEIERAGHLAVLPSRGRVLPDSSRAFEMAVLLESRQPPNLLAPTSIVIHEDAVQITDYECAAIPNPESLSIGFAIPRETQAEADPFWSAIEGGLDACLEVKSKGHAWSVAEYDRDFAASLIQLMDTLGEATSPRHILFCIESAPQFHDGAMAGVLQAAQASQISVNGIVAGSGDGCADLRRLCLETGGNFLVTPAEGMAYMMLTVYQGLSHRYAVTYRMGRAEAPARVEVAVYCTQGCGKSAVDF
jgi:hypothetical protein